MKIGMTSVLVNDPVEAFEIYTKKLGFIEVLYMPEAQLAIVASADDPNGTALLLEPMGFEFARTFQEEVRKAGLPIIVFTSDNIQKEYERLLEAGVKFKKLPTKTDWGIEAIFDDGCGNYIQLQQMN
ncbi:MAG: VOC family protein [Bacteroidales bacterium]|nr:VOC family protein [Bacteroidales bacterium]